MFEQYFTDLQLAFALNLILCTILGYSLGRERELKGKAAGISTQILVMGGAMAFSFISSQIVQDPARIAAGIVTGVGFLGAGIIFHQSTKSTDHVVNLTTAATIWLSAAAGMAIGFGYYIIAILCIMFGLVALNLPHPKPRK